MKLGFIALTDCASILMAKELEYFEERNLNVTIEKQASWPATRDNLLTNQIDGCHGLYTLPLSVATGIGGDKRRDIFVAMMLNNNGQAITLANDPRRRPATATSRQPPARLKAAGHPGWP